MAHMVTLVIFNERANINTLVATVKSAIQLTHSRDPETGSHLERMAHMPGSLQQSWLTPNRSPMILLNISTCSPPVYDLGKIKSRQDPSNQVTLRE